MASNLDERQLLAWFASCITALTSSAASGGGTTTITQMVTSIASQASADTGLTAQEKSILTAMSTGIGNTKPSSCIHGLL